MSEERRIEIIQDGERYVAVAQVRPQGSKGWLQVAWSRPCRTAEAARISAEKAAARAAAGR